MLYYICKENGNNESDVREEKKMTITTIKFYYNGIKINGEKSLVKLGVYGGKDNNGKIANEDIYIIYDWHWSSDFFAEIQNISEYSFEQPRYWGDDGTRRIKIATENPLYPYFKYMIIANKIRDLKYYYKHTGKGANEIAEYEVEIAKFPKAADAKTVELAKQYINGVKEEIKQQEEIKRQEEEAERKRIFDEEAVQKEIIKKYMNQFPIGDSKIYVRICWSEHPAFYDWNDNELTLSVKAAELILTELDKKPEGGGYHKTKFEIIEDGEVVYTGRYDLGDEEGGLFNHLTSFADYEYKTDKNEENYREHIEFINALVDIYAAQEEVIVEFADGFNEFVENYKKNKK